MFGTVPVCIRIPGIVGCIQDATFPFVDSEREKTILSNCKFQQHLAIAVDCCLHHSISFLPWTHSRRCCLESPPLEAPREVVAISFRKERKRCFVSAKNHTSTPATTTITTLPAALPRLEHLSPERHLNACPFNWFRYVPRVGNTMHCQDRSWSANPGLMDLESYWALYFQVPVHSTGVPALLSPSVLLSYCSTQVAPAGLAITTTLQTTQHHVMA